jgi:hypothetical protein
MWRGKEGNTRVGMSGNFAPHYPSRDGKINDVWFRTSVPGKQSAVVSGPVVYNGIPYGRLVGKHEHHHFKIKGAERLPGVFHLSSSGTITYDPAKNAAFDKVASTTYHISATYTHRIGDGPFSLNFGHEWALKVRIGVEDDGPPPTTPVDPSEPTHPDHGHPSDPTGGGEKPPARDPAHEPTVPDKNANPNVRLYAAASLQVEPATGLVNLTEEEAAEFLPGYANGGVFDVKVHDTHPTLALSHQPKVVSTNFGTRADVTFTIPGVTSGHVKIDRATGVLSYTGLHAEAEDSTQVEVHVAAHYQTVGGAEAKHYTVFAMVPVTMRVEGSADPAAAPVPTPATAGESDDPDTSTHPSHAKVTEYTGTNGLQWYAYAGISVGVIVLAALVAWAVIRRRRRGP